MNAPAMFSLKNKTALVTGAASGIGAAMAETFAQAGATIWIADRNEAAGRAVAERLGGKFISLEVASETDCLQRHKPSVAWTFSRMWRELGMSELCSILSPAIWTSCTR
jgi:NAD(P)-dependent dehydrogenase (short-subunit alcohol dehydrogenase family)